MTEVVIEEVPKYRTNAQGYLVPENLVKPVDALRDGVVKQLVIRAKEANQALIEFKQLAFGDIAAFVDLSAEKYGATINTKKGNMTLLSFDGKQKVQIQTQDRIAFSEQLQAAKALIDACIEKWSKGGDENLVALIHDAFNVDKEGNIDARRILALRRVQIEDMGWKNAMQAISDAVQVVGSTAYIRFYEKDEHDKFQSISLDFASL